MTKIKFILNLGFTKELMVSFIPSVLAYLDFLKRIFTETEALVIAFVVLCLSVFILMFIKITEYRRCVSKALATGYFKNFVEKLVVKFNSKQEDKINFILNNGTKEFLPKQITIKIYLPDSEDSLRRKDIEIQQLAGITYVDSNAFNRPFFVWAKEENNKLVIYDLPRTLFSLKHYVTTEIDEAAKLTKETKPFYELFNSEFEKLWLKLDMEGLDINLEYVK